MPMVAQGRERALKLGQPLARKLPYCCSHAPAAVNQGPGRARMELMADAALCRAGELGKLESPVCQCRGHSGWNLVGMARAPGAQLGLQAGGRCEVT
jgi:hypothetical protein